MKRIAIKLIVLMILGAVTTVAVAWGCALWIDPLDNAGLKQPFDPFIHTNRPQGYVIRKWSSSGVAAYHAHWTERLRSADANTPLWGQLDPPPWAVATLERAMNASAAPDGDIYALASGWPLIALRSYRDETSVDVIGGIPLPSTVVPEKMWAKHPALPLIPVWSGFALDVALYGILWGWVVSVWSMRRRMRQFRRGRCPLCGYDQRHDYARPCPECGRTGKAARAS